MRAAIFVLWNIVDYLWNINGTIFLSTNRVVEQVEHNFRKTILDKKIYKATIDFLFLSSTIPSIQREPKIRA